MEFVIQIQLSAELYEAKNLVLMYLNEHLVIQI